VNFCTTFCLALACILLPLIQHLEHHVLEFERINVAAAILVVHADERLGLRLAHHLQAEERMMRVCAGEKAEGLGGARTTNPSHTAHHVLIAHCTTTSSCTAHPFELSTHFELWPRHKVCYTHCEQLTTPMSAMAERNFVLSMVPLSWYLQARRERDGER